MNDLRSDTDALSYVTKFKTNYSWKSADSNLSCLLKLPFVLQKVSYDLDALMDYENASKQIILTLIYLLVKQNYQKQVNKALNESDIHMKYIHAQKDMKDMEERLKFMQDNINNLKEMIESKENLHKTQLYNMEKMNKEYIGKIQYDLAKASNDKNEMILKFAKSEKEMLDWKSKCEKISDLYNRDTKVRDKLNEKLKNTLYDLNKTTSLLDDKVKENNVLKRDFLLQKDHIQAQALTLTWTQDKLNEERENQKKTKHELDKTVAKFMELRLELNTLSQPNEGKFNNKLSTNITIPNKNCSEIQPLIEGENLKNIIEPDNQDINTITEFEKPLKNENLEAQNLFDSQNEVDHLKNNLPCILQKNKPETNNQQDFILSLEYDVLRNKHEKLAANYESEQAMNVKLKENLSKNEEAILTLKTEIDTLNGKIEELQKVIVGYETMSKEYNELQITHAKSLETIREMENNVSDLSTELSKSHAKQKNLLELTENLTSDNAKHLTELEQKIFKVNELENKVNLLDQENETLKTHSNILKNELVTLRSQYNDLLDKYNQDTAKIEQNTRKYEDSIAELRTQLKCLQKKYFACQKDLNELIKVENLQPMNSPTVSPLLQKQQQQGHQVKTKSLTNNENDQLNTADDVISIKSFNSLLVNTNTINCDIRDGSGDYMNFEQHQQPSANLLYNETPTNLSTPSFGSSSFMDEDLTLFSPLSTNILADKKHHSLATENVSVGENNCTTSMHMKLLIDKSIKLQRALLKRKEKIELLNDHIIRLQDELHKKAKIIQNLLLSEQTGAITLDDVNDKAKAKSMKMNLFEKISSVVDSSESMHELNDKLQMLLEESLLKIIVLKEGMENLGQEISKLAHENKLLKKQVLHLPTPNNNIAN